MPRDLEESLGQADEAYIIERADVVARTYIESQEADARCWDHDRPYGLKTMLEKIEAYYSVAHDFSGEFNMEWIDCVGPEMRKDARIVALIAERNRQEDDGA